MTSFSCRSTILLGPLFHACFTSSFCRCSAQRIFTGHSDLMASSSCHSALLPLRQTALVHRLLIAFSGSTSWDALLHVHA
ncbi:unnamed protein product [Victoria cruziana]